MGSPYQQYKSTQVKTANQGKLIIMLYDGAIRFLKEAEAALPAKKYDVVNNNIIKTQNIITELMISLNMKAGDISANLYRIYDYMNRRLIEANVRKDMTVLREIIHLLSELREVWIEVVRQSGEMAVINDGGTLRPGGLNIKG